MDVKLTNEMRDALAAHPGQAVPIVDDESKRKYFLVEETSLLHLQGLAVQQNQASHQKLQALIQEGIRSDHVAAEVAESRIRKVIQSYSDDTA